MVGKDSSISRVSSSFFESDVVDSDSRAVTVRLSPPGAPVMLCEGEDSGVASVFESSAEVGVAADFESGVSCCGGAGCEAVWGGEGCSAGFCCCRVADGADGSSCGSEFWAVLNGTNHTASASRNVQGIFMDNFHHYSRFSGPSGCHPL